MKIRKCTWVISKSYVQAECHKKSMQWHGVMNYYRYCPYCGKAIKWE